eukprot:554693-Rhodomonas_salina.1
MCGVRCAVCGVRGAVCVGHARAGCGPHDRGRAGGGGGRDVQHGGGGWFEGGDADPRLPWQVVLGVTVQVLMYYGVGNALLIT